MSILFFPWATTRIFSWDMDIIKGDFKSLDNPFHWYQEILNSPRSVSYNNSIPRVYKWNQELVCIIREWRTFVDDLRSTGATWELFCANTHRVETMMGYLRLKDDNRKRLPITQAPGEWYRSTTRAIEGIELFVAVSQKKWYRLKEIM